MVPTLLELAEAGVHFGHHQSLTFPKARDNIFMVKNNISLINLEKTQVALEKLIKIYSTFSDDKSRILVVGTKRSVRDVVCEIALANGLPYVTERWFGGTLTNFATVSGSLKKMNELREYLASDEIKKISKKDRLVLARKLKRYERFLGGMKDLSGMPKLLIVASATEDKIAVEEANQMGLKVIAITDTDVNPEKVDYAIPANDDAPKSVAIILKTLFQSGLTVKEEKPAEEVEAPKTEKKVKTAVAKKVAVKAEKVEKPKAEKKVAKPKAEKATKTTKKVKEGK